MKFMLTYVLLTVALISIFCNDNSMNLNKYGTDLIHDWEKYSRLIGRQIIHNNQSLEETNRNESQNLSNPNITLNTKLELLEKFKRLWPVGKWRDLGYFTDDFLNLINEHWLYFSPPNEIMQKVLATIYIFFSTAGCWGNMIVLFMYFRVKRSQYAFDNGYVASDKDTSDETNEPLGMSLVTRFKKLWPLDDWREYGFFTDDFIQSINPHWLQFPPPKPSSHYALGILYIVIAVIGLLGNSIVLLMYYRCRTLRTPGNILVANLALSDFLMLAKTPIFIFNSFHLGPALGKTGCVIYGFAGGLSGTTSIATLTAIALDRYWAVVHPLEPLRALTAIRARLLAVGAWLYAGVFATIPALDIGYGQYVPEGFLTSCSFDYLTEELPPRYFIFAFFCAGWLAPLCIISYCYTSILRIVVGKRNITTKNQEQKLSSRHVKEQVKRKAEIKIALLVIVVIALFFISWTPYAVVALLGIFGQKDIITPLTSMVPALFCKTAACINPFIYIITHPTFRKEFQKLLFRDKSRRLRGTLRTTGYYTDTSKMHRQSKQLSETDVEVVEMKDIPYHNSNTKGNCNVETVSSKVSQREGSQKSQRSVSIKEMEENVIAPPSWYSKPQFAKKKSFHRRSTKSSF